MAEENKLPQAGYRLQHIYAIKQSFEVLDVEELKDPEDGQMLFGWDWRITNREESEISSFEVRLELEIEGVTERPERIAVNLVGGFELVGEEQSVELQSFVMGPAPALLMPYLRERISAMSAAGSREAYHFPVLNVVKMMEVMTFEESTGWKQMQEHSEETSTSGDPKTPVAGEEA